MTDATQTIVLADAGAHVDTVHGGRVPLCDVAHIAPHLRAFAIEASALCRDPDNARRHGSDDLRSTAASLARYGQRAVLWFDRETGVVKVGNGRHEAAESYLGWRYVAALPWDGTPDALRAFALVDNRTAELSSWDPERLRAEVDAILGSDEPDALPPLDLIGLCDEGLEEVEAMLAFRARPKAPQVEAKPAPAEDLSVTLKCESAGQRDRLLAAIHRLDAEALVRVLRGVRVGGSRRRGGDDS